MDQASNSKYTLNTFFQNSLWIGDGLETVGDASSIFIYVSVCQSKLKQHPCFNLNSTQSDLDFVTQDCLSVSPREERLNPSLFWGVPWTSWKDKFSSGWNMHLCVNLVRPEVLKNNGRKSRRSSFLSSFLPSSSSFPMSLCQRRGAEGVGQSEVEQMLPTFADNNGGKKQQTLNKNQKPPSPLLFLSSPAFFFRLFPFNVFLSASNFFAFHVDPFTAFPFTHHPFFSKTKQQYHLSD